MGNSASTKAFVNALNPETNGVAKAFNPNTNGVTQAFQKVGNALNPTTNGVAKAFETAGTTIESGLTTLGTDIKTQVPAGLATAGAAIVSGLGPVGQVLSQTPIGQLVQGNTSGFVSSLENEANWAINLVGLNSVASSLGLGQPQAPSQIITTTVPPNGNNLGNGSGSSAPGSDPGIFTNDPEVSSSDPTTDYTEYYIIGGVLIASFILFR